jgi:hypothetical protein
MGLHTSRHTRKNSSFSTQDEHLVLLGLEALTAAPNLRYATRSILRPYTGYYYHIPRLYAKVSLEVILKFSLR